MEKSTIFVTLYEYELEVETSDGFKIYQGVCQADELLDLVLRCKYDKFTILSKHTDKVDL